MSEEQSLNLNPAELKCESPSVPTIISLKREREMKSGIFFNRLKLESNQIFIWLSKLNGLHLNHLAVIGQRQAAGDNNCRYDIETLHL